MIKFPEEHLGRVVDTACQIQQIPGPTFHEEQRAAFIFDYFTRLKLSDIHVDPTGNVWARIPGQNSRPVVLSAHLDTVHPLTTKLKLKREADRISGPAIGDNSLGLAGMLELAQFILDQQIKLSGDLVLIANVGEEGLGNLSGMKAVVDHLGSLPLAYLVIEGVGLGQIYHRALGVERYQIDIQTPGGHSWADHGRPSAIHEMANLVVHLTQIPLKDSPRSTINIGTIGGGTSVNTIAAEASIEIDVRSEDSQQLNEIVDRINRIVQQTNRGVIQTKISQVGNRPVGFIHPNHPLVTLAKECLIDVGLSPHLGIASTDANIPLHRGYPSVCIGLTTGGNAHTTAEFIDTLPLKKGMTQLANLTLNSWLVSI